MFVSVRGLLMGAAIAVAGTVPAQALSMQQCSAKYKAAQAAGALKGMKWNAFRKAECGGAEAAAVRMGRTVFPTAIAGKYANQTGGKARMQTCLDQYNANKSGNGNGGLKWIEKGGGYYSECNKRLSQQ